MRYDVRNIIFPCLNLHSCYHPCMCGHCLPIMRVCFRLFRKLFKVRAFWTFCLLSHRALVWSYWTYFWRICVRESLQGSTAIWLENTSSVIPQLTSFKYSWHALLWSTPHTVWLQNYFTFGRSCRNGIKSLLLVFVKSVVQTLGFIPELVWFISHPSCQLPRGKVRMTKFPESVCIFLVTVDDFGAETSCRPSSRDLFVLYFKTCAVTPCTPCRTVFGERFRYVYSGSSIVFQRFGLRNAGLKMRKLCRLYFPALCLLGCLKRKARSCVFKRSQRFHVEDSSRISRFRKMRCTYVWAAH